MSTDLLESLQILPKLALHAVGEHLGILPINNIPLSVEEPSRNLVLGRILDDGDDSLQLLRGDFPSASRSVSRS